MNLYVPRLRIGVMTATHNNFTNLPFGLQSSTMAEIMVFAAFVVSTVPGTLATIAGLTYMDNMDFQERFRNVHECDPFYYHPLHLPEYCADMFEKLIRSRIGSRGAVRVIRERNYDQTNYKPKISDYQEHRGWRYLDYDNNDDDEVVEYSNLSPSEQMYFSLANDVKRNPISPEVMWTNRGPIAVYRQPISKASKNAIYQNVKKATPKRKKAKKHGRTVDFKYGGNTIKLKVDKNDAYWILEN